MASSRRVVAMSRLFALTAVGLCIIASRADSADIGTSFRRGIGISHAMAWARIDSVTRDFAFPPFAEPANALTGNELQSLRRTGFDFPSCRGRLTQERMIKSSPGKSNPFCDRSK